MSKENKEKTCENCKQEIGIYYKSSIEKWLCYKCFCELDNKEKRKKERQRVIDNLYYEKRRQVRV